MTTVRAIGISSVGDVVIMSSGSRNAFREAEETQKLRSASSDEAESSDAADRKGPLSKLTPNGSQPQFAE